MSLQTIGVQSMWAVLSWPVFAFGLYFIAINWILLFRWMIAAKIMRRQIRHVSGAPLIGGVMCCLASLASPAGMPPLLYTSAWKWLLIDYTLPLFVVSIPWMLRDRKPFT